MGLSRFTFCLNCRVDVASVASGSLNDVLSTLLVFGVPNYHNLRLGELLEWLLHQQTLDCPFDFK